MTLSSTMIKHSSSSGNFTWEIVFWKLFTHVFLLRYLDKRCKCVTKLHKTGFFYWIFCILPFLDQKKAEKNLKNIETTIIDVKIDEESKSALRIGLPCNDKPGNLPNNEGKLRKVEKKRLTLFPNPPIPIVILESFSFESTLDFRPLCQVWANLKMVFLLYEFFKNRGVFPIVRLFLDIQANSASGIR